MQKTSYARHRFPREVIQHAVWLYFRFPLSFRDVEDLLAERGVDVSYETVRRWAMKFGLDYARKLRRWRCHIKSDLVESADNREFLRKGFQRLSLLVDRPNCANFA